MKGDGAAGFSFCVQRPGETVFMEKAVGHCVLTVSGIPREFKDFRTEDIGAVLLSSWVVSSRTDGDEPLNKYNCNSYRYHNTKNEA